MIRHRWIWLYRTFVSEKQKCPICNLLRRRDIGEILPRRKRLTPRPRWEYKLDSNFAPLLRVPPCPGGPKKEESA